MNWDNRKQWRSHTPKRTEKSIKILKNILRIHKKEVQELTFHG